MGEYIEKFLDYIVLERNFSELTAKSYQRDLKDFEQFLIKSELEIDYKNIDKRIIRNFVSDLSKKNISTRTINRKVSSLRSFFKFLMKIDLVQINPCSEISNLKVEKKVLIPYTYQEIQNLEQYFEQIEKHSNKFEKERNILIFEIFYQTGIRRSELISLVLNKINFDNKTISVIGKRNKQRNIPITETLRDRILKYLSIRNSSIKNQSEFLFCDENGYVLKEKFVYTLINKYLSVVTTKSKKSPHMLRHTFASHLLNNGAELNSIKEILGHSSLAATQVYTHSSIEDLKKVFNQSHPNGGSNLKKNEY